MYVVANTIHFHSHQRESILLDSRDVLQRKTTNHKFDIIDVARGLLHHQLPALIELSGYYSFHLTPLAVDANVDSANGQKMISRPEYSRQRGPNHRHPRTSHHKQTDRHATHIPFTHACPTTHRNNAHISPNTNTKRT